MGVAWTVKKGSSGAVGFPCGVAGHYSAVVLVLK
jgi:hypothetical protein